MRGIDLAFYGGDTLSLLLGHVPVGDHQRLLQLPLDKMASSLRPLPMFGDYAASLNHESDYGLQCRDQRFISFSLWLSKPSTPEQGSL